MSKDQLNHLGQAIGFSVPNWQPCARPSTNIMQGRFCRLEPVSVAAHGQQLFDAFCLDVEGGNWTYLPYGPFNQMAEFAAWLTAECQGQDPLFHTIIDEQTGKAVGLASYLRINPAVGVIEVGHIHFSPLMQRTPMATECMYLMMRRVFDELGYRRYEWKCDNLNVPSKLAAERLGFSYDGLFKQATMYKGRNRDTAWFSILDSDWPNLKQGFENWLQVANFDAQGQQIRRLQDCI
jgi:RimJ/RimL family protein N-acetyltransferase